MKSVLIIASTLMALSAEGKTTGPADSLKISKDISLDEVVVTATKVAKGTPVAYSELVSAIPVSASGGRMPTVSTSQSTEYR
mgnify:CR=1 FL=1